MTAQMESVGNQPGYVTRLVEPRLVSLLAELPGVLIVGPRAAGKTTTARRYAKTVVRLDREAEAAVFRADPDAALKGLAPPVLLDEWQSVPEVLGAVKRSIDDDSTPGRFIVTGSVRADLESATWPATGRLVRLYLYGLTMAERAGAAGGTSFLEQLLLSGPAVNTRVIDAPDIRGYLELAHHSGFPEPALRLSAGTRREWLASYIDQLLTRDVELVDRGRDPDRLRRFFSAYVAMTAQTVDDKTLWEAAGIDRRTMISYEQLLKNLFVIDWCPAWVTNRLKRLVHTPKRYVVDPALASVQLGAGVSSIMREGSLLGPILDTFTVAQIRAELAALRPTLPLYHLRLEAGRHEVDALIELEDGHVVAFEIKAAAAVSTLRDAKHLQWLRDELGDRFRAGVVFHTGPHLYHLDDRIIAAPIAALWS